MKKLMGTIITALAISISACWFTNEDFDNNYIAGANNYVSHYESTPNFYDATYYNGGNVSLPITVYVKLSRHSFAGENRQIKTAILQYKTKHNGKWGRWKTVKTLQNLSWDMSFDSPVPLFGRESINPRGLVKGDEILIRFYLSDGIYENGDLDVDVNGDNVPDVATPSSGGTYEGGWTAPFIFKVTFNGQYWR